MDEPPAVDLKHYATYVSDLVKKICVEIGPGVPFTPNEARRANALKKAMGEATKDVTLEAFQSTNAYLGWFRPGCVLCLVAVIFYFLGVWGASWTLALTFTTLSLAVGTFVFLILILEFFLSVEFIDPLFPKRSSQNVVGRILPPTLTSAQPSIKRLVLFSGHHDTSPEFLLLKYLKSGYFIGLVLVFSTVLAVTVAPAIRLGLLVSSGALAPGDWTATSFAWFCGTILPVGFCCGWWFLEHPRDGGRVPGAIDNLTSSCMAVALAHILAKYPQFIPPETEIRVLSFGAEEANMRGASAYARAHLAELRAKDAVLINMESIASPHISILTSDNNGFTKNDPGLVHAVDHAAASAGVPHDVKPFQWGGGGTDAFGFRRYKLKATSLFALKIPEQMVAFYHQATDNYDKVNGEAIQHVLAICLQFLREFPQFFE